MKESLRYGGGLEMTRRVSVLAAIMALATSVLVPGMAVAQTGSPPAVAGVVIEQAPPAPAPVVAGESLPRTGSELIPMIGIALALLVLGVVLVLSVRRRQDNGVRLA